MNHCACPCLENDAGFEAGVGPSLAIVAAGKARSMTATTGRDDAYALKGSMADLGLQGSKISKVDP